MERTLLVSGSSQALSLLSDLIKCFGCDQILTSENGSEARRIIGRTDFDMIIISTPLPDEFGKEFALTAADKTNAGIMLITKSDVADELSDTLSAYGICVIAKPLNKTLFFHSIKLLQSTRARMMTVMNDYNKLQTKIEETRIVSRAKCVLIQYLKLTEPQAHRYIEKQAMDSRQSKVEVAQRILKTYEM